MQAKISSRNSFLCSFEAVLLMILIYRLDTLSEFKRKITINKSWKFYTVMTVIARESELEKWKTLPSRSGDLGSNVLLENSAIKFILLIHICHFCSLCRVFQISLKFVYCPIQD
jgi:hypothetical protein